MNLHSQEQSAKSVESVVLYIHPKLQYIIYILFVLFPRSRKLVVQTAVVLESVQGIAAGLLVALLLGIALAATALSAINDDL